MTSHPRAPTRFPLVELSLGVTLVVLPWSLGGAPAWARIILLVLAWGASGLWLSKVRKDKLRVAWHPVFSLPLFGALVAALQLVPLPPAVLAWSSPYGSELRDFALLPLGLETWRPISVDPPATARAFARLVALLLLVVVSREVGRSAVARRVLLQVLCLCGVSFALCGFGHLVAGAQSLFGVVQFFASPRLLTPLGNINHLAAWLALCGTLAVGLSLSATERDTTLGWALAALTCGLGTALTLSRGGIAALVVTWTLVALVAVSRRAEGSRALLPWVLMVVTGVLALGLAVDQLAVRAGSVGTWEKLQQTKLHLWPQLLEASRSVWPAGFGLGAFELGFPRFQTEQFGVTFTHPENLLFQWACELGWPLTVVLAGLVAWVMVRLWRDANGQVLERVGVLALVGVGLHEVFDFALELDGLAAAVAVVAGLLAGAAEGRETRRVVRQRGVVLWGASGLVAGAALVLGWSDHRAAESRLAAAVAEAQEPTAIEALARQLIDRHPSDWVLYATTAADLSRRGPAREALAWVNRHEFLLPRAVGPHVTAARALARLGHPEQALGELRVAWALGDGATVPWGLELASRIGALRLLVVDRPGQLGTLWGLLSTAGRYAEAEQLLAEVETEPVGERVKREAAVLHVRLRQAQHREAEALDEVQRLPEREQPEVTLLEASLLSQSGRASEATALLARQSARHPDSPGLAFAYAAQLDAVGRPGEAVEALDRLKPFVVPHDLRVLIFSRQAELEARQGHWGRCVDALRTAIRLEPSRPDLHYRLAGALEQMGAVRPALEALRRGMGFDSPEGARAQAANVTRLERVATSP